MNLILAIEPDDTQADALREMVSTHVDACLEIVCSTEAALSAMAGGVPDLILIGASLAQHDTEELLVGLRSLDGADHLQTLTVPPPGRPAALTPGTPAPVAFPEQIAAYLAWAGEIRVQPRANTPVATRAADCVPEDVLHVHPASDAALAVEFEPVRTEAEARRGRVEELARWQVAAETLRAAAVDRGRVIAAAEAREALTLELARATDHAEQDFADALARVRRDAAETLALELTRARDHAERLRETELSRVRAEAEARLLETLAAVRRDAEQTRLADRSAAERRAAQIREEAARESRETSAAAEEAARATLEGEIARVRAEGELRLVTEVARLRAEAEQRRTAELEVIRAQLAEVQEAAARQARALQARSLLEVQTVGAATVAATAAATWAAPAVPRRTSGVPLLSAASGNHRDAWGSSNDTIAAARPTSRASGPVTRSRRVRWALSVAAALALVTSVGASIDVTSWGLWWGLASRLSAMGSRLTSLVESPAPSPPAPVSAPVPPRTSRPR